MVDQILKNWGDEKEIAICFANTGKEEEATLEFVDAVDRNFCRPRGHKVAWLEAVIHGPGKGPTAKEVTFETADREGKPFEAALQKHGIFCRTHPQCTTRLKEEPMDWWRKNILGWGTDYVTAIGIRADEIDRVSAKAKERRFIYPLADWGWRKRDVSHYMARFDWDLKIPGDHWGNCDCCWKKSLRKLMTRAKEDPSVFDWWSEMERRYGRAGGVSKKNEERVKAALEEIRQAGHEIHGEVQRKARVFFRENRSAPDIIDLANSTDFEPYEDDKFDDPDNFDRWWDVGSACGESCEIGADNYDISDNLEDSSVTEDGFMI